MGVQEKGFLVDSSESDSFLGAYKYSALQTTTIKAGEVGRGAAALSFTKSTGKFQAVVDTEDTVSYAGRKLDFTMTVENGWNTRTKIQYSGVGPLEDAFNDECHNG